MQRSSFVLGVGVLAAAVSAATLLLAQSPPAAGGAGDWPLYNRDLAGTRYSPLKEINASNVSKLAPAWSYTLQAGGSSAVPLVVGGVMYVPSGGRVVGARRREREREVGVRGAPASGRRAGTRRPRRRRRRTSVAARARLLAGRRQRAPRILFLAGNRLMALDAADRDAGREGFGTSGVVEIGVPYNGTPTVCRNVVVIGANVNEVPQGPPGNPRAFDVRTGKKLWEFQTVPKAGEKFNDTWGDGWKDRSGTNMWGFSALVDATRGIVYLPIAGPAANYYGGDRPGNNLFANSVVALDIETGDIQVALPDRPSRHLGHDLPSVGSLVDVRQAAAPRRRSRTIGKTGYMFILDRVSGKPMFGVEERPVPKGDVPTEWYSPTQPFPVKPRSRWCAWSSTRNATWCAPKTPRPSTSPSARRCDDKSGGFCNDGPFTPFKFTRTARRRRPRSQFPGGTGGVNWGGTAADPTTGLVYMNAHDTSLVGWVEKKKPGVTYSFERRRLRSALRPRERGRARPVLHFQRAAQGCGRQGAGAERAVSASAVGAPDRGQCQHGRGGVEVGARADRSLPEGKQLTGNSGSAGPSVTAGGLVFVGATNDRRFRAFDAKTGKELWSDDARAQRERQSDVVSGRQRQAVRGGRRDRHRARLRASVN